MRRFIFIILVLCIIFAIWVAINHFNPSLDITAEYSNGKIITHVTTKGIQNITSTEFRYRVYFLDQYINVEPRVRTYSFSNYKKTHIYEIREDLFQGKKDYLEVEVEITYDDGNQKITKKTGIKGIKEKIYNDFVIVPEIKEDKVYYRTDGLTAIIDRESYDDEIIFYSDPNSEYPNISVGFHKDYALYSLSSFEVISKNEALEENYVGFSVVDFTRESGVDESYIVIEYGMIELYWDGLYPYDLEGNKVFYEGKQGDTCINLVVNNKVTEVSKASHEKYEQMLSKMPNIAFIITKK
ncbi:hypothetical protein Y919_12005 [Caloranaerobacter azorensis H53214]|uniref:Uncharacterized protein n=1 Tax=Caloranaerobacter azorensis H53214 TaxID=1156417 RepID=A0A096CSE2_9FIRM|nr:hypothetical protein [Caloranaerobacter azorensis]KGG79449.1 hypothetical protein Y919_12005 [Caloranaerobacter azorensis H53214]